MDRIICNRISIRETLGNRSRGVRNVKEKKCLDQISTRNYRVNGRCMDVFRYLARRVASSEKNIEIENWDVCINGYGKSSR